MSNPFVRPATRADFINAMKSQGDSYLSQIAFAHRAGSVVSDGKRTSTVYPLAIKAVNELIVEGQFRGAVIRHDAEAKDLISIKFAGASGERQARFRFDAGHNEFASSVGKAEWSYHFAGVLLPFALVKSLPDVNELWQAVLETKAPETIVHLAAAVIDGYANTAYDGEEPRADWPPLNMIALQVKDNATDAAKAAAWDTLCNLPEWRHIPKKNGEYDYSELHLDCAWWGDLTDPDQYESTVNQLLRVPESDSLPKRHQQARVLWHPSRLPIEEVFVHPEVDEFNVTASQWEALEAEGEWLADAAYALLCGFVTMLCGAPGFGKTRAFKLIAKILGWKLFDFALARSTKPQHAYVDIASRPTNGQLNFVTVRKIIVQAVDYAADGNQTLLGIDELDKNEEMTGDMLQLLQPFAGAELTHLDERYGEQPERRYYTYYSPMEDEWHVAPVDCLHIIVAGNYGTLAQGNDLPAAMGRRIEGTIYVGPGSEEEELAMILDHAPTLDPKTAAMLVRFARFTRTNNDLTQAANNGTIIALGKVFAKPRKPIRTAEQAWAIAKQVLTSLVLTRGDLINHRPGATSPGLWGIEFMKRWSER